MSTRLTATVDRYIVSVNGVDVSSHIKEREALESAVNRVASGVEVKYRHDYVVVVQGTSTSTPTIVALSGVSATFVNED